MPRGHDPDPVGRPWRAVVIVAVILAVGVAVALAAVIFAVGVAVALAAVIFAVALVAFRAACGILRKL